MDKDHTEMTAPSLVEEVAKTIGRQVADLDVAPRGHWELAARAAIAVVLRRMEEWNDAHGRDRHIVRAMLAAFRKENGVD